MINEFLIRLGNFFTVVGIALMIFFAISYLGNTPDFKYFFFSLISLFIGWQLSKRKAPPPPSGRFATLRRMRENSKKGKGEEKKEKE
ncbi:MAG TPA: hypothetical protein VLZ89_02420 [Anaerolineales bacterium]|nr:hypothetical protein [Anaerolineales bacterium]